MDLRIDPYPGPGLYPSGSLWPGIPLDVLDDPAGWIITPTGSAVPYALLLSVDQSQDRRADVIDALNGSASFLIGAEHPARPRWHLRFLLRTLTQARALSDLVATADSFTISEWGGRALTGVGEARISAQTIEGAAAWWTYETDAVEGL